VAPSGFLGLTVSEWLEALAAADPVPGGGSAAAMTGATAAALVAMTARLSPDWDEASGVAAQAMKLRGRLAGLAQVDAEVYAESLEALAGKGKEPDKGRDFDLGTKLDLAAEVPLQIAHAAGDTALLAADAAENVPPELRPDAHAAAALAAAAAEAAARLVEANLVMTAEDPRVRGARRAADVAAAAVQSAR
jgi:formiminotetrahydrofolate cyclodeaminase